MNFSLHNTGGPSSATATPGARDLPAAQKPRRRRVPVGKIVALTLVVAIGVGAVAVLSVPGMSKPVTRWFGTGPTGVVTYMVKSGPLPIAVEERGSLESSSNVDVYCNVEGGTTIIKIVPEGTRVKKGELICELDSASLKDQLINQRITTKSAEANFLNAKLTREVAEIAVKEYVEGVFVQDEATAKGEIKLAESDLTRSEDRLEWARRMSEKGYVSKAQLVTEELNFKKAQFALEQAQSKLDVLLKYTKDKTIKELESEVKKAHSDELAKQATFELEKSKEEKLEKQIAYCTLTAPIDGLVVYANDPSRMFGSNQSQIEEGATVRERQKVISIPDINRMQVNVKVHEAQVDNIKPGLKAQIRVDAFPESQFTGVVTEVAPLPDATNIFSSDIKVYTTKVRIDNPREGLKPGMTAQAKILVDQLDNVLSVPVLAVLQYNNKDHVAKKVGDQFNRVEVTLGATNGKFVQVTKGLADGDVVALNPMSLMSEEEKREAFRSRESKKDWGKGAGEPGKDGPPGAAAPGKGGPPGAGAAGKGSGKSATKKGRGAGGAMFKKFQNLTPDERARMKTASPEEKAQLLKKAGFTEQEMEMMKNFGGGGGGGGFGGGGFGPGGGRGRPGGGPPGGSDQ